MFRALLISTTHKVKSPANQPNQALYSESGFLAVAVEGSNQEQKADIRFAFYDENGKMSYQCRKTASW
jgi:hypothetical protein